MYNRALAGREKALGPDHSSTLTTVNNLGVLYADQGCLAEAEKMYNRALAGLEKALGPDHSSTLNSVFGLGIVYRRQGHLTDAERMYRRALVDMRRRWGQTTLRPSRSLTVSGIFIGLRLSQDSPITCWLEQINQWIN